MNATVKEVRNDCVEIAWEPAKGAEKYHVYWADKDISTMKYQLVGDTKECSFVLKKATHVPHYLKVAAVKNETEYEMSNLVETPLKAVFHEQLEKLNRGLIAVKTDEGVYVGWRMFIDEVRGYSDTGLTGADYAVYRGENKIAVVTDSTNYLDTDGTLQDTYSVAPIIDGKEEERCKKVFVWKNNYIDIPMNKPADGRSPKGEMYPEGQPYTYSANDMSIGDVDGDGELEYIVKWDPSNAHDVSHRGYTGNCYIDCYRLDGTLLWRVDMGPNIRSGAHYTQFMVYDFDGDGKAEMCVKTAPGTKVTRFVADGTVAEEYITLPERDVKNGVTNQDNYVCTAADYKEHLVEMFMGWSSHPEVVSGRWPATLEECFGIPVKYHYPLSREDAKELVSYFIYEFAPSRSDKNHLEAFEGFIYDGPEYLTMFGGDGKELETIDFPVPRGDDGLMWGDYAMRRIEPCNRVDRFLSGVAYLDGEHPSVIICRGYYTRSTVTAYDFKDGHFAKRFMADSGHVPMSNPFNDNAHEKEGLDPVYGKFAGQGDHSLSVADVDGDGCQEIIYGAAVIDHDGSLLYSSYDHLPDGRLAKLGHGDAMHVARINPDLPGYQIFNVFEGAKAAPYGFALRDALTGKVFFGEYAEEDLGRCMIGDVVPGVRGLQVWVKDTFDCNGNKLDVKRLGTNANIHWACDMTTQIIDGVDYMERKKQTGIINDNTHGIMLDPQGTLTNNGTKGNPCLVADIFGDYRDEIILRLEDSSAVRIYTNTDLSAHKLFTLLHDIQYRVGVAWQNNCYNQPCYTKFYLASDMEWKYVLPALASTVTTR